MTLSLRTSTLVLAFVLSAAPFAAMDAQAKDSFMTMCSAKFKAAKADGSIDAATKWTDFMKTTCKADQAATTDAPAVAAPAAKPVKMTKAAKAPAVTPSGSFMEQCSAAWKTMKADNTVPDGMTWKAFVAGKCVATPAAATVTTAKATAPKTAMTQSFIKQCGDDWTAMKAAGTVPAGLTWKEFVVGKCVAKPVSATAAKATNTDGQTFQQKCSAAWKDLKANNAVPEGMTWKTFLSAKCVVEGAPVAPAATPVVAKKTKATDAAIAPAEPTTTDQNVKLYDKNGKAFTPGQLAAHERARTCGRMWQDEKSKGTLESGMKWPQYWSQCNTQLKATQ